LAKAERISDAWFLVDGNPLADISALQDLVLVIHDGKVVVNHLNP